MGDAGELGCLRSCLWPLKASRYYEGQGGGNKPAAGISAERPRAVYEMGDSQCSESTNWVLPTSPSPTKSTTVVIPSYTSDLLREGEDLVQDHEAHRHPGWGSRPGRLAPVAAPPCHLIKCSV